MTHRRHDRLLAWLARFWVEYLALLALLFILVNTLVPFDFGQPMPGWTRERLLSVAPGRLAWADATANVALFVPFGCFGAWALMRRGLSVPRGAICTCGLATGISLAIEFTQAFSPARVSSLVDVVANATGSLVGVILSLAISAALAGRKRRLISHTGAHPHEARALLYVALLLCLGAMPFVASINKQRLVQAWKQATWTPFAEYPLPRSPLDPAAPTSADSDDARRRWVDLALADVAELLSFGLLVWILIPMFRIEYGFGRFGTLMLTAWSGLFIATILGAIQFFVIGRGFHATDGLARLAGTVLGLVLAPAGKLFDSERHRDPALPCSRRTALALTLSALAFIVASGTNPYALRLMKDPLGSALAAESFLPFFSYFRGRFDSAMLDLMSKAAQYGLLGAGWAAMRRRDPLNPCIVPTGTLRTSVLIGILLASLIEAAQAFIAQRIPSLTDVVIPACACPVGGLVSLSISRLSVPRPAPPLPPRCARDPGARAALSLTDRLLEALLEHPGEHAKPAARLDPRQNRHEG